MKLVMEQPASSVYKTISLCSSTNPIPSSVLAGALLEQCENLLDRGLHPMRIADGFDRACSIAVQQLDKISDKVSFSKENTGNLLKTAMTSLGSKMYVKTRHLFSSFFVERSL